MKELKPACECKGCHVSPTLHAGFIQPGMSVGGHLYECGLCGWEFCEARMSQIDDPDPEMNTCILCDTIEAS